MTQAACDPFVIERVFDAPRETVWKAWTTPEALSQWFGPKGANGAVTEFDLRPGGLWRGWMIHPNGTKMYSKSTFREVTPPERLVWEQSSTDADGNVIPAPILDNWPLIMLTTVTFEDMGNRTKLTLTWLPLDAKDIEVATFEGMKPSMTGGWSGSFDVLDDYLAKG